LSLANDDIFRGHSVSEGHPVGAAEISYDHSSGLYAGAEVAAVLTRDNSAQFLRIQENFGYARTIRPKLSVDIGIVGYTYSKYYSGGKSLTYVEPYIGITKGRFSAHLHYAPDYLAFGQATLYADVDGGVKILPQVHGTFHIGLLEPIGRGSPAAPFNRQYDWRAGVAVNRGAYGLRCSLVGVGPNTDYYAGTQRGHTTITVELSRIF
jgi:uncharacterized protein (TIGR02001 family)